MNRKRYTATVIAVSIIMGLAAGAVLNTNIIEKNFGQEEIHEHALFFAYANNTEIDLTANRFQLQDREVHLENDRNHIVHKHAEGVTWGRFLETIDISINHTGNQSCLNMPNKTYCGNMTLLLNGEEFRPEKEIRQGDKLAVVIAEDSEERAEAYMELDLPEAYRKILPGQKV